MQCNKYLRRLDLSHNEFCSKGGTLLGAAIAVNSALECLDLSWNHLRLKGATALAKGIKVYVIQYIIHSRDILIFILITKA